MCRVLCVGGATATNEAGQVRVLYAMLWVWDLILKAKWRGCRKGVEKGLRLG